LLLFVLECNAIVPWLNTTPKVHCYASMSIIKLVVVVPDGYTQHMEDMAQIKTIRNWLGTGAINIFGFPFAGKDTHGQNLATDLGAELIGGGAIIRSPLTTQHMKDHIAKGLLTPTEEYLKLMLPYFSQDKLKEKAFVLSSVGRWFGEHTHV